MIIIIYLLCSAFRISEITMTITVLIMDALAALFCAVCVC